jgi:hypothetical protein
MSGYAIPTKLKPILVKHNVRRAVVKETSDGGLFAASIPAIIREPELAFDAHKWRDFECYGMIPHTPSPHSLSQPPT